MTNNLFVIDNVKQLRTGGSFKILLPVFWTSWGVGGLTSGIIFNNFHNRVEFGMILEGLPNFGEVWTPQHLHSVRHCTETFLELKYLRFIRNSADYLTVSSPSVHNLYTSTGNHAQQFKVLSNINTVTWARKPN